MFHKKYHYTAVEIDAEVLRLANVYGVSDLKSSMDFRVMDAYMYAAFCEEKFDMICMDVFLDDTVPTELENDDFLNNLKDMLTPNGILLFNKLAFHKKDKIEADTFFKNRFKRIFKDGTYLDVDGNFILLNRADCLRG